MREAQFASREWAAAISAPGLAPVAMQSNRMRTYKPLTGTSPNQRVWCRLRSGLSETCCATSHHAVNPRHESQAGSRISGLSASQYDRTRGCAPSRSPAGGDGRALAASSPTMRPSSGTVMAMGALIVVDCEAPFGFGAPSVDPTPFGTVDVNALGREAPRRSTALIAAKRRFASSATG